MPTYEFEQIYEYYYIAVHRFKSGSNLHDWWVPRKNNNKQKLPNFNTMTLSNGQDQLKAWCPQQYTTLHPPPLLDPILPNALP